MSTTLRSPPADSQVVDPPPAAARLRTSMTAMRLSFTWFGVRKALSTEQKHEAAASFGAEEQFLSAGKKLLDTRHPRFKAVAAVRRQASSYFQGVSLPYPEPAVRLIRREDLDDIQRRMNRFQEELAAAVGELDERFDDLRDAAREKLGRLFCAADYPASLAGLFGISWEFPNVEPPDYLRRLSPQLYQEECRRVAARFDEAVQLTEQMFLAELNDLVQRLAERLSGDVDGKPKVFRDSAVDNFAEFFQRFQRLNIRSSNELEEVVQRAQQLIDGVDPRSLRDSTLLRGQVHSGLAQINQSLAPLLVDRPRRNILRRAE